MTIKQAQKQVKQALKDHGEAISEGRRLKATCAHILARTFLEGVDHGLRLERKRRKSALHHHGEPSPGVVLAGSMSWLRSFWGEDTSVETG